MASTLLLDRAVWDLTTDAFGNIALADAPYAMAQDAASAVRLFKGECYYDLTRGVPYFEQILGKAPPLTVLKAAFVQAAMSVPDVTFARAFLTGSDGREIQGQVQLTTKDGSIFGFTETLLGRAPAGALGIAPRPLPPVLPAPATAVLVRVTADGDVPIVMSVTWTPVPGSFSYHVQFSLDSGLTWTVDASQAAPANTYILAPAVSLTPYRARVAAVDELGRESLWTISNVVFSGGAMDNLVDPDVDPVLDPGGLPVLVRI